MSIKTRVKNAAEKTGKFLDEYGTAIITGGLLLGTTYALYALHFVVNDNVKTKKRLDNLEYVTIDMYDHPTHSVENEDGSFTVTRLSKRMTDTEAPSE